MWVSGRDSLVGVLAAHGIFKISPIGWQPSVPTSPRHTVKVRTNTPDLGQQWRCQGRGEESPRHRGQGNSESGSGKHGGGFFFTVLAEGCCWELVGLVESANDNNDGLGEKPTRPVRGLGLADKGFITQPQWTVRSSTPTPTPSSSSSVSIKQTQKQTHTSQANPRTHHGIELSHKPLRQLRVQSDRTRHHRPRRRS